MQTNRFLASESPIFSVRRLAVLMLAALWTVSAFNGTPTALAVEKAVKKTAMKDAAKAAPKAPAAPAAEPAEPAQRQEDKAKASAKLPAPEDLSLQTTDGVELVLTYYPGSKGKQSIPVVLLHGFKQSRSDFAELAKELQSMGCAVIAPDLRGHGDSTRVKGARKDETLKAAGMPPMQFGAMVTRDMEVIKKFLWEKNNEGELNIDKLCILGSDMGASVALNFTLADAAAQDVNRVQRPDYKLGRFVKALVLISPELSFRGLPLRAGNARAIPDVAMLILVGKQDPKAMDEAKQIHRIFEKFHPEPTGDDKDKNDKRTLFFGKLPTSLQGDKLLDEKFNVPAIVADFIDRRLVKSDESREWTWRERKFPHG
jgi:pimeloyl-ACP methyl ester carboxylesterase